MGLAVAPGRFHAGRVVVADIGLEQTPTRVVRATPAILDRVPRRSERDTKFTAGSLLVVGGAPGTTGAAVLTALAALRADAGYVTLAVPEACLAVAETLALEPVKRGFPSATRDRSPPARRRRGPRRWPSGRASGARRRRGRSSVTCSTRPPLPVVVDADGLFSLEPVPRDAPVVLTPHAGELARLLDVDAAWVNAHRLEAVGRVCRAVRAPSSC